MLVIIKLESAPQHTAMEASRAARGLPLMRKNWATLTSWRAIVKLHLGKHMFLGCAAQWQFVLGANINGRAAATSSSHTRLGNGSGFFTNGGNQGDT